MVQHLIAICFGVTALFAKQYIVSYHSQTAHAQIVHESLFTSPVMQPVEGQTSQSIALPHDDLPFDQVVHNHQDELLEFLFRFHGVHVKNFGKTLNQQDDSLTLLTLPPTYLQVEFNDHFVIISPILIE